ncbi:MAG TPA: purine-nucleoside phosphorylase [Microthrixaceae bacterium]|nr:purine-nucleoside phosphorylase [Microthrixaceae bacterium]
MITPRNSAGATPNDLAGNPFDLARDAAEELGNRLGEHGVAVVLGSGWADIGESIGSTEGLIPMTELPGIPRPTVPGHGGTIRSVKVDVPDERSVPVLVLAGRSHLYEGHSPATVVHAVRAAVLHGCSNVLLTNAAGSLRPEVGVGSAVMISDQVNLSGANPLCGDEPPPELGGRFVDLSSLYSRRLIDAVHEVHPEVSEGVYAGVLGGSYETPAEIRMLRLLGADLVGMSTVLESIAAHHLGAEVFGLSLVTNLAAGLQSGLDHSDVLSAGSAASGHLAEIISTAIRVI